MHEYRYRIDEADRLTWVSSEWVRFAEHNAGQELRPENVIGRSLWEFVAGWETAQLYRQLFAKVREEGRPLVVPFRCDAPWVRRFMRLGIHPARDGCLELVSTVSHEEERESVPLLDVTVDRSAERIGVCSWCGRVRVNMDRWEEVEVAIEVLNLFDAIPLPRMSHGACPECFESVMGSMGGP